MQTAEGKRSSLIWGFLLIVLGVAGLLETLYTLDVLTWAAILAGSGLVVLFIYFSDRSEAWPLIPSYVLFAIAGLLAVVGWDLLRDEAIATYVLIAIALPFIAVYLRDQRQWWALIPAYVMVVVAFIVLAGEGGVLPGYFVGTFVLAAIGLPFLVIFLRDRRNWWALIPAYAMFTISLIIPLSEMAGPDTLIPAYVMFAIALPFWVVFFRNREHWWPLVPGGITTLIGVSLLLREQFLRYLLPVAIILAGVWVLVRQLLGSPGEASSPAMQEGDDPRAE